MSQLRNLSASRPGGQRFHVPKALEKIAANEDGVSNIYRGIQIENDPMEREIYVACPFCKQKVFDSGLENDVQ